MPPGIKTQCRPMCIDGSVAPRCPDESSSRGPGFGHHRLNHLRVAAGTASLCATDPKAAIRAGASCILTKSCRHSRSSPRVVNSKSSSARAEDLRSNTSTSLGSDQSDLTHGFSSERTQDGESCAHEFRWAAPRGATLRPTSRQLPPSQLPAVSPSLISSQQACAPQLPQGSIQRLREGEKIFDLFRWSEVLQEQGDGGKVVVCRRKQQGPYAQREDSEADLVLKMKAKASYEEEDELKCRKIYARLLGLPPHPCVMNLQEVFEDDYFFYAVMPRANGGTLIDGLLQHFSDGIVPASALKALMRDILEAIGHVHSHGLLHCDVKPDNLVLQLSQGAHAEGRRVVLIDFDHADPAWQPSAGHKISNDFVGTPRFAAPETFRGQISQRSDLYSAGAVLYLLVTGKLPYGDETFSDFCDFSESEEVQLPGSLQAVAAGVHRRMVASPVDFSCAPWKSQPACRELCEALLQLDPSKRPSSADEALSFPWLAAPQI